MPLKDEANKFAAILTEVVNGTVSKEVDFVVTLLEDGRVAWIFPRDSSPGKLELIPILVGGSTVDNPRLWLNVWFKVKLDSDNKYLTVQQSQFSLVLDKQSERPAVRIEYDRDKGYEPDDREKGIHRRSAAHVQIHGVSEEIAYIQGLNGTRKLRNLSKFHIPVGGRRFRPSLEDFIEFLSMEDLISGLHLGWQDVLTRHRSRWLEIQLRSAIRSDPNTTVDVLRTMGFLVSGPSDE